MTFEFEAINRDLSIDLDIEVEGVEPRLDDTIDERTLEVRQESFSVDFVCSDKDGRKTMSLEMGFCPSVSYRVNPDGTISIIIQSLAGEFVIDGIINSVFLQEAILASEAKSLADAQMYTDRKWQDAQEAQALIAEALLKEFTNTISPVAINTMQALFGSESLQYMFIVSEDDDTLKPHAVRIDYHRPEPEPGPEPNEGGNEDEPERINPELICPDGVIKHYTLGITEVRADLTVDSFMRWVITGPNSDPDDPTTQETRLELPDDDAAYYLYIKATKTVVPPNAGEESEGDAPAVVEEEGEEPPVGGVGTAEFIVSTQAKEWDSDENYYYFLYATIGKGGEDKDRAITYWNGFTEITPGRITAYKFVSPDGVQYIDFLTKNFRLGDAYSHLMFDHALGKLFLKGTITQSPAGTTFPTPCNRGVWIKNETGQEPNQVAYYGDLFTYEGQSWLCINELALDEESAIAENPAEDSSNWQLFAAKGGSASSGLVLNLTNDSASINCDKDGHILPGAIRPTCTAALMYGITRVEGARYSITTPSVQQATGVSINGNTGVLTFGSNFSFEGTSIEITVTATYETESRTAIMTVAKSYPGVNGDDAVSYWLVLSADTVKYDPNAASPAPVPATVTASAMKQVGSNAPVVADDCSIFYGFNTQSPSTAYTGAVNVDITKSYLAFVLKKGDKIVDGVEIIPILREGKNGDSPVFADLDNEMEGVALNSEGKTTEQKQLVTNVSLSFGTIPITLSSISVSGLPEGITETHTPTSSGRIVFTIASGTSVGENVPITITLTGSYKQSTYSRNLTFTIAGVKAGANGDDAVIYSILPSVSSVKKDKDGNYSVSEVSCARYKRVGNSGLESTTDGTLKYKIDNGAEQDYTSAISTSLFNTSLTFLFFIGTTLVDKETVLLLYDGVDGEPGAAGKAGPMPRGLSEWNANGINGWYQGGDRAEDLYKDFVIYNEQHYVCIKSHQPTQPGGAIIYPTNTAYWSVANEFEFIATKAMYVDMALIENATVKHLQTNTEAGKGAVHASTGDKTVLSVADQYGNPVLYASDNPISGGSSSSHNFSLSNTYADIPCYVRGLNVVMPLASLSNIPSRAYASIPQIVCTTSNWPSSLNGTIEWSLKIGATVVASGSSENHRITIPAIKVQLPEGSSSITLNLKWFGTPAQSSIRVTCPGASASYSVSGSKNEFGTDGFQSKWGTEGVKVTSAGAKVISGNNEYAMVGASSLNGLSVAKKIVLCTAYPATEDPDTLYIKVS